MVFRRPGYAGARFATTDSASVAGTTHHPDLRPCRRPSPKPSMPGGSGKPGSGSSRSSPWTGRSPPRASRRSSSARTLASPLTGIRQPPASVTVHSSAATDDNAAVARRSSPARATIRNGRLVMTFTLRALERGTAARGPVAGRQRDQSCRRPSHRRTRSPWCLTPARPRTAPTDALCICEPSHRQRRWQAGRRWRTLSADKSRHSDRSTERTGN